MKAVKTRFEPGDIIADRYRVESILGRGGMGMVYLVNDSKNDQKLALKTLLPQYATNEAAIHRFNREVQTVRRLNHPAIVRIHDAARIGPLLFYTMDYIEGRSVRSWLGQRGRLGLGSTVRILSLVAHALEHAHEFTIHRDLSPENIMVLPDGSIRLLDFGLAKLTDSQAAFTQIGISLGKRQYNSPEQTLSATDVDHRTDIYALGVMFHEMLSGYLPQDEMTLTQLIPGLPKECDDIVARATAKSPDDRFQTAREFREALLHAYQESLPQTQEEAQPPTVEPALSTKPTSITKRLLCAIKRLVAWPLAKTRQPSV